MNQAGSEESLSETELRVRIAAGSEELQDYLELADLLRSDARDDDAMGVYEQALGLRLTEVQRATVLTELSTLLAGRGERDRARTLAGEAVDLVAQEPDSFDVLMARGLSLFRMADLIWGEEDPLEAERIARLALQALERAIPHQSDASEAIAVAHYAAAWLHSALGDQDRAIALCQRSLGGPLKARDRPEALNMLAEAFRLAGRLEEAEEAARRALALVDADSADLPGILVTLGFIQRAAGRPTDARESFARAVQALQPHQFLRNDRELLRTIFGNLAELYYEGGNLAAAIGMFEQLLTQYPEDSSDRHRILNWLGRCHVDLGAHTQARRYYEQVLASPIVGDEDRADAQDGLTALPSSP